MTQEEVEIVERCRKAVVNAFGRLVAKNSDGKVIDSGSTTFIQLKKQKFLGTAHHVVSELFEKGTVYVQFFGQSLSSLNEPFPALEFRLSSQDIVQFEKGEFLDVAAIHPPLQMVDHPMIRWFMADKHAEEPLVKAEIVNETTMPQGGDLLGFPRFSRFENLSSRQQIAGMIPIQATFISISEPPQLNSYGAPQVVVKLDHPEEPADLPMNIPPQARDSVQQFWDMVRTDQHALDGYSGGPLIYFYNQEPFLVGIIKEGGMSLGGIAFATPIDIFAQALSASLNQSQNGGEVI